MGLKGSAANTWATMTFRRDVTNLTFFEMEEMLMIRFFQQHSLYTLWGQWTSLKQGLHKTSQAYYDRVKDLLDQKDLPEQWAAIALIAGIREPLRTRFYDSLPGENDRSLTLDEVSLRFVLFEETRSAMHR